jgi:hypothetical protein
MQSPSLFTHIIALHIFCPPLSLLLRWLFLKNSIHNGASFQAILVKKTSALCLWPYGEPSLLILSSLWRVGPLDHFFKPSLSTAGGEPFWVSPLR